MLDSVKPVSMFSIMYKEKMDKVKTVLERIRMNEFKEAATQFWCALW